MTKNKDTNSTSQIHFPVMSDNVLAILDPKQGETYLDLTAGYGGHANQVLERTLVSNQSVLVDRDQMAIDRLRNKFLGSGVQLIHKDFLTAAKELLEQKRTFDIVLADLGVSSPHLNTASRGFSFRFEAPLDMRMDQRQELTAGTIVNDYPQKELEVILRNYGEEPKARQIAKLLVDNRPIETTTKLASVVAQAWPGYSKVHPATRTFQALRIAVNDELRLVKEVLPHLVDSLSPGGRLAIITFHSLEDRIVKQYFSEIAGDRYDTDMRLLTKKPILPSQDEIVLNPRSRSAKLRAVAKIKNKKKGDA
ncbi:16S rRNA (cytosine(1402)-N(4))-methyltransferase RsmH [Candidatus Saccharibacteria bacterium]|nr:16S rRNA (cytosine(1402)-N(4))-methyltransferase RsmH [Candidatus Saccharibacteria bacterium]